MSKTFAELGCLSKESLAVIKSLKFTKTTPVQEATIPLFLSNKDVAVDACTGSGKTLAFVLPVVEMLRRLEEPLKRHQVGAVIVSPTRELAKQIFEVAEPFVATVRGLTSMLLVGGSDPKADVSAFLESGAHVVIGTPGRVDDVMKRCPAMDLRRLEVLVLDEADRLLEMGFERQVDAIISRLPKQRRTGLFSATQTDAVKALARAGLRNPIRINVALGGPGGEGGEARGGESAPSSSRTPSRLRLTYVACTSPEEKVARLQSFLEERASKEKCIVYFLTCACVDYYGTALPTLPSLSGLPLFSLHGKMKQRQREAALSAFTAAPSGALLCTDLAARGLDIQGVDWVLQFDPPQDPNAFVHRAGRTARAGRAGSALAFLLPHEATFVEFLKLRRVPLKEEDVPGAGASPPSPSTTEAVWGALRGLSERDRDPMEKGVKAFVAYVRGYKEHQCKYIFRLPELDMGGLARSFGLLRLPSMSELKGGKALGVSSFTPSETDPDGVKFKDKAREKQRLAGLAARLEKRQKEKDERVAAAAARAAQQGQKRQTADKRRKAARREDLDEMEEDYALLRKVKKGKVSEDEFFARTTGMDSDLEDSDEEGPGAKGAKGAKGKAKKGAGKGVLSPKAKGGKGKGAMGGMRGVGGSDSEGSGDSDGGAGSDSD